MAFLRVDFYSQALGMAVGMNVILPETAQGIGLEGSGGRRPAPVLYLLHGLSDDHTIWARRTGIERYAARRRMAVVMPFAARSFYANEKYGERYWDFISQELPAAVAQFFRVSDKREDTFVAGLSMGGYGALKLALRCPERFCAAASFSGAMDIPRMMALSDYEGMKFPMARVFGSAREFEGGENDVYALLQSPAALANRPRLYVSCGAEDPFLGDSRRFVREAREAGYEVTSGEIPGMGHCWDLWDGEIEKALDWMGL